MSSVLPEKNNEIKSLKILIAGCGYVGTALGHQLVSMGHQVWGLRRNINALPSCIQPIAADMSSDFEVHITSHRWNIVYYTASAAGYTEAAYEAAYVTQVSRLLRVLENSDRPPDRFIYTSSTGVYHQQDGSWLDENSPVEPTSFSSRALILGEEQVFRAKVPGIVVRLAGIYGPGRTRLIDQVVTGDAVCVQDKTAWLNLIHREDCAGILAHLLDLQNPEPCYLAVDCAPVEKNTLLRWIAAQLELPEPKIVSSSDLPAQKRGGNRRYRNRRIVSSGYRFIYPTFREGYHEILKNYR